MRIARSAAAILLIAAVASPALAQQSPAEPEKLICKRWTEAGSLVRKRKQCHTAREWEQLAETERRGAQRTVDGLTERSSCSPSSPC